MKLRGVSERQLAGLLRHGPPHRLHSVPDAYYGRLACGIEVSLAIGGKDPAALAEDRQRIVLAEISRKERRMPGHVKFVPDSSRAGQSVTPSSIRKRAYVVYASVLFRYVSVRDTVMICHSE